jgi:hypothetical protein
MAFSSVSVVTNALTLRRWRGAADVQVEQPPATHTEPQRPEEATTWAQR